MINIEKHALYSFFYNHGINMPNNKGQEPLLELLTFTVIQYLQSY